MGEKLRRQADVDTRINAQVRAQSTQIADVNIFGNSFYSAREINALF